MRPLQFSIQPEYPVKSVGELKREFYKWHSDKIKGKRKGLNPNALVLNPPQVIDPSNPFAQNTYYAVYCRHFFVTIVEHHLNPFSGPHIAKLQIQVFARAAGKLSKMVWLGTAQLSCNFFNRRAISKELRKAIRLREYFSTEEYEAQPVVLDEAQDKSLDIY